jgi:phage FluMu gp28-like protein
LSNQPALLDNDASRVDAPPPVLLPYQQAWVADDSPFKIAEKSRRVGWTWAEASDDVLIAAKQGGTNVFYIGPTQDMALEFIEACAMWARVFNFTASQVEAGIFEDEDKDIKTYKIDFPMSGRRILALSSRPTNLRGKQGVIVIDEAAFHPNLKELLKAAMAMLLWGDKVRVFSTHDGADNPFAELITEVRSGRRKGKVHRITSWRLSRKGCIAASVCAATSPGVRRARNSGLLMPTASMLMALRRNWTLCLRKAAAHSCLWR